MLMIATAQPTPLWADSGELAADDNQLLLLEVVLDRASLSDALPALQVGDDIVLIPVGALTRLLDLDVQVSPADGRLTGQVGQARQSIFLDIALGEARAGTARIILKPGDALQDSGDIYLTVSLMERLLPVRMTLDVSELTLNLEAREKLPVQMRAERMAQGNNIARSGAVLEPVLSVAAPAGMLSFPAFDVTTDVGSDTRGQPFQRRFDVRASAAFLNAGFQGYLASDDRGKPALARLLLERREPKGGLLGPLQATSASLGDTFLPALALGPRSVAARGFAFSTRPLEQASIFERVDIRGELPRGHDVQIYVNDILSGAQSTAVEGRYEFDDVPLVRGLNVIRIVDYGPNGSRTETTRVISVGSGQAAPGELIIDFGIGEQGKTLVGFEGSQEPSVGAGLLVGTLNVLYGFSESWTGAVGLARYSSTQDAARFLLSAGVRGSVFGLAVQGDAARDSLSGYAAVVGVAGKPFGIASTIRRAEFRNGFVDDAAPHGGDGRALRSGTEATFDFGLKAGNRSIIPVALRIGQDAYVDGQSAVYGTLNMSLPVARALVSASWDYNRVTGPGAQNRLTGNVSASFNPGYEWQVRGGFDYDVQPSLQARSFNLAVDRSVGEGSSLRLAAGQSFVTTWDTTAEAGLSVRLPIADLTFSADYSRPRGDWSVGIQLSFSLAPNPLSGRYAVRRSGAASGGNLAFESFFDSDGNGRRDPGELPVSGLKLKGGTREEVTDGNGRALVTGLGYGPSARVTIGLDDVDLPYVAVPPQIVEFAPVRGKVAVLAYPFKPVGEALVHIVLRQPTGKLVGLSSVRAALVGKDGMRKEAVSEFDGSIYFESLPPGTYDLQLDREQAGRLGMAMAAPVSVTIPEAGGMAPDANATVIFEGTRH
ncbi:MULTISPECIES: hypothetical protein [unclassified Sphingobium]|uniref:hypothetical protein n=1 Tax=unclassified Sphingobium TaxID=2611147 RepID=UPI00222410C8|nr:MULTISPECIES: hypothetical protein [unclassified Sphingobium]MCW2380469.1 hypothetical protein [Sphingobium sp. B2D3B]MCW2399424.1 hypothetical protein [Sphingobium sp. B2D3C]